MNGELDDSEHAGYNYTNVNPFKQVWLLISTDDPTGDIRNDGDLNEPLHTPPHVEIIRTCVWRDKNKLEGLANSLDPITADRPQVGVPLTDQEMENIIKQNEQHGVGEGIFGAPPDNQWNNTG